MSEIAKHWIDGEWVGSETVSESVNPATGAVLGRWADGGEAEARAAINDGFAEGGYKQSGVGRLRGPLAISEFTEAKTVVHAIPPFQGWAHPAEQHGADLNDRVIGILSL